MVLVKSFIVLLCVVSQVRAQAVRGPSNDLGKCPAGLFRSETITNGGFEDGTTNLWTGTASVSGSYVSEGALAAHVTAGAANIPVKLSRTFLSLTPRAVLAFDAGFVNSDYLPFDDSGKVTIAVKVKEDTKTTSLREWTVADTEDGFSGFEQFTYASAPNFSNVEIIISATNALDAGVSSEVVIDNVRLIKGTVCDVTQPK